MLCAVAIVVFLYGGLSGLALDLVALVFGVGLACSSAWGVWFTELYPERLRPHGAALFHAGHIIAMAAPLFITVFSASLGLRGLMVCGAAIYLLGAAVWLALPETLGREATDDRAQAVPAAT